MPKVNLTLQAKTRVLSKGLFYNVRGCQQHKHNIIYFQFVKYIIEQNRDYIIWHTSGKSRCCSGMLQVSQQIVLCPKYCDKCISFCIHCNTISREKLHFVVMGLFYILITCSVRVSRKVINVSRMPTLKMMVLFPLFQTRPAGQGYLGICVQCRQS